MKVFILFFSVLSLVVFGYTTIDVSNANHLATKGIITQQPTATGYRLDDSITRAEVIGTALKLKGVALPEGYLCKKKFSDTTMNDWICRAVEIAAENGLISQTNIKARPNDSITRAEAFSILFNTQSFPAGYGTVKGNLVVQPFFADQDIVEWQKNLFIQIYGLDISVPLSRSIADTKTTLFFYPNRIATRAEIFSFAKNVLEAQAIISGEVNLK